MRLLLDAAIKLEMASVCIINTVKTSISTVHKTNLVWKTFFFLDALHYPE